jgi:hypothetical protein
MRILSEEYMQESDRFVFAKPIIGNTSGWCVITRVRTPEKYGGEPAHPKAAVLASEDPSLARAPRCSKSK